MRAYILIVDDESVERYTQLPILAGIGIQVTGEDLIAPFMVYPRQDAIGMMSLAHMAHYVMERERDLQCRGELLPNLEGESKIL